MRGKCSASGDVSVFHPTDQLFNVTMTRRNLYYQSKHATYGPEVWMSCQPLDRFCLMLLRGLIPSCLLMSEAYFSLTRSTCRKVWISSSIYVGEKQKGFHQCQHFKHIYFFCFVRIIHRSCITFASSIRRLSKSSSVRSEAEHPLSVILVERLLNDGAPPKPSKEAGVNKYLIETKY